MREVCVVSVGRSDFGIYRPVLNELTRSKRIRHRLVVTGAHLLGKYGFTYKEILKEGFRIHSKIHTLPENDGPEGIASGVANTISGFSKYYRKYRPDMVLVLGDRFEMFGAAAAAVPFNIPIAHLHGGEVTEGAIDDAFRHSITKFSHIHFVSTQESKRRVIQLGEEPWRVHYTGAPGLDNLSNTSLPSRTELERLIGIKFDSPPIMVTFHPVTRDYANTKYHAFELVTALSVLDCPIVITKPNADTNSSVLLNCFSRFVRKHKNSRLMDNLGTRAYFGLMSISSVMIGNSSSGIIEAASFKLPVVNIGTRQKGRFHGPNVIDCDYKSTAIIDGIRKCLNLRFKNSLRSLKNPYQGKISASEKIVKVLEKTPLNERLVNKRFIDISVC